MAAPVFIKEFNQDIRKPIFVQHGGGLMFTGDANADTITVHLYDGEAEYTMSGSVALNCIRADGATVSVAGTVSGNTASATLAQACCAVAGPLAVVMKVTADGTESTILKAVYTVDEGQTGTTVDPGTIIPDVAALIDAIETAVGSIPAEYSDLLHAVAVDYTALTFPVSAGAYCWYGGTLYKAKVDIPTSESWTAAHWQAAVIGEDIADLKSALYKYNSANAWLGKLARTTTTSGGITYTWDGANYTIASATASAASAKVLLLSEFIPEYIIPGDKYTVKYSTTNSDVKLRIIFRTASDSAVGTLYLTGDTEITVPAAAQKWTSALYIAQNTVIGSQVTVGGDIQFITAKTNKELETEIPTSYTLANKGVLPKNTSINTVTEDGRYFLNSGFTYTDGPVDNPIGALEVLHITNNSILQRITGFSNGVMYLRTSQAGSFIERAWIKMPLMSDSLPNKGIVPKNTDINVVTDTGIWLLSSEYTYMHAPFSSIYGGVMLVFKFSNNTIVQMAVNAVNSAVLVRSSLLGVFPDTWNSFANVTNNNYTTEHYENTYNITCEPEITADTNNYLASTGDQTDRSADIQAMLSSAGVCHLGPGLFMVTGIEVPSYATLEGSGTRTMLRLASSVTNGYAVKLKTESRISNMRISGGTSSPTLSATVGTRHGILFEGTKVSGQSGGTTEKRSSIDHVWIRYFEGGGITCNKTGVDIDSNLLISDCFVDHCGAGLYIPYYSEFHRISNCAFTFNWYGCIDNGGNNNFSNCDFSGNRIGILIDNSSDQSPNNSHGTFSSCSVNHSYSDAGTINEGTAIKLLKSNLGEIFIGMQIFYGAVIIDKCVGTRFIGANIGRSVPITVTDSTVITFSDCTFYNAENNPVTKSNNTALKFTDCYLRDGTVYDPVS